MCERSDHCQVDDSVDACERADSECAVMARNHFQNRDDRDRYDRGYSEEDQ